MSPNEEAAVTLRVRFGEALKEAMKARDRKRVSTLRLVLAAIKDRDIANRSEEDRSGVAEEEILSLLARMIKQREESAMAFEAGGRPELAASEREEIRIIREFQPRQMNDEEMRAAVSGAIKEFGATTPKDMGQVMSVLKTRYSGRMDFGKAAGTARDLLAQK